MGLPLPAGERDRSRSDQGEGLHGRGRTPEQLLTRSRELRTHPTEAEARLWERLRGARLNGLRFRRQVPLGSYIVDFLCPAAKLVVELDGSQHVDQQAYDARRTSFLEGEGYRVLRVWNNDVLARPDAVLEAILAAVSPLPGPARLSLSPQGRGR
ncbi:endonuclease domain-containing protein [uncultured Sphingomonas sp.]|uniref:endonuclease domain-containing protein n=1 Tax=uncultured Sphingomonas sp. TaxID=158754 RepID=UPI0035C99CFD